MEALYLLASLAATLVTSAFQSLLLFLRLLFQRGHDSGGGSATAAATRLYEGRVRHSRRRPAAHAFEYPVRYALVDLDRMPLPDHLSADEARRIVSTSGPVRLLTIPKSVGYEQNPLNIYYCYNSVEQGQDGELRMCIAEVTNTPWGERVMFTFQPESDLVAKPLHVSPFMDMLGNWSIRGRKKAVAVSCVGRNNTRGVCGRRRPGVLSCGMTTCFPFDSGRGDASIHPSVHGLFGLAASLLSGGQAS